MKVKLRTITPLFIGKSKEDVLVKYNWYLDENNKKAEILKQDLLKILIELGLNNKQIKSLLYNKKEGKKEIRNLREIENSINNLDIPFDLKEKIKEIITKNKVILPAKIYGRSKEYKTVALENFINFEKNNEIHYYLPGSSLKGALRTYIVFKILLDNYSHLVRDLANNLNYLLSQIRTPPKLNKVQIKDIIDDTSRRKLIRKYLSNEQHLIHRINNLIRTIKNLENYLNKVESHLSGKNKLERPEYEWLYGFFNSNNFIIRDSEILNLNDFIVLELKRKKRNEDKQGIPNLLLALSKDKEVTLDLEIKNNRERFFGFLKEATKEINNLVIKKYGEKLSNNDLISKLEDLNKNELLINIGRFSGASVKSLLSLFMNNYPVTFNLTPDNEILGWTILKI